MNLVQVYHGKHVSRSQFGTSGCTAGLQLHSISQPSLQANLRLPDMQTFKRGLDLDIVLDTLLVSIAGGAGSLPRSRSASAISASGRFTIECNSPWLKGQCWPESPAALG